VVKTFIFFFIFYISSYLRPHDLFYVFILPRRCEGFVMVWYRASGRIVADMRLQLQFLFKADSAMAYDKTAAIQGTSSF